MRLASWVLCAAVLAGATAAQATDWNTFVIRKASDGTAPQINNVVVGSQNATEFIINLGSQKAAWGTSLADGMRVSDLAAVSIDRLDDTTRFAAGSGPAVGPYINIWITDPTHTKHAVIANEPSDGVWRPAPDYTQVRDITWDFLKTKVVKVYEITDKSWLPNAGVGLTFADLANFIIEAPTATELAAGWTGLGTGAPREFGTNQAYGFNWVFGDTLSNYVSGQPGYVVANPAVAVPEPASLAVLGLGMGAVLFRRRRVG